MPDAVNQKAASRVRPYRAPQREAAAVATRRSILAAARDLFSTQGYARTTVAQIARRAAVAVDTVYASVGRKPALMRELVETALSGSDVAVPALERDYVTRVQAAPDARDKLETYALALVALQQRLAPVFLALQEAAATDATCRLLWQEIAERRASNMRMLAADLRATGQLRTDLSDSDVADVIWSLNAPEYYDLLVKQRGWTPQRFGAWLSDAWQRLLLAGPPGAT